MNIQDATRRVAAGVLFALAVSLVVIGGSSGPTAAAPTTSKFVSLPPTRVLDSRIGLGSSGSTPPGGTVTLSMLGRGGVVTSGVVAVLLNVTVTEARGPGYVQVFPTGVG